MNTRLSCIAAMLLVVLAGCARGQDRGGDGAGTSGTEATNVTSGTDGTGGGGPTDAPGGGDGSQDGHEPTGDAVTRTKTQVRATYTVYNNMTEPVYLVMNQRPLSLIEEEPCITFNMEIMAQTSVVIECRFWLLSDHIISAAAEWYASRDAKTPEAMARTTERWDGEEHLSFLVEILPGSAMTMERVE